MSSNEREGQPPEAGQPEWTPPPQSSFTVQGQYVPPPRIKNWMVFLVLGVALLVGAIVLINHSTNPGVKYQHITYTTQGLEAQPVTISGLLMKPTTPVQGKRPGVVFANGLTGSKEWYVQVTRPLVLQGFVVLSIDLRGHGGSGGYCTYGTDEVRDMWAGADYLVKNVPEVDPSHIIAMGHSLGGVTATRAVALQPDNRFSAVAAIWCWTGFTDALDDLMGPLDDFIGRAWFLTPFSRHVDVNAPNIEQTHGLLSLVNDTTPRNYMLAIGRADELVSVDREQQIIDKMTAAARAANPNEKARANVTYGSFADGTARRLVLTDDDHVTELVGGVIDYEAINWIMKDAGIPEQATDRAPFLWGRFIGLMTLALSLMMLSMGTMSLVRLKMFPDAEETVVVEPPWGRFGQQGIWEVLIYGGAVLAASYLAMPFAKAVGIGPFIPYVVVNEASIFNVARSLLLLPVFVGLMVIVTMRTGGLTGLRDRAREYVLRYVKNTGYGLIPLAIVVIVMLVLGGMLLLPRAVPKVPLAFVLGVLCMGGAFWMEDYMFYKIAYPALERESGGSQQWLAVAVHGVILDLVLVAAFMPLMKGFSVKLHFQSFHIPLLLVMIFAVPVLILVARLSYRLRKLTGSSLAYALLIGTLAAWFFTAPIGVRGF